MKSFHALSGITIFSASPRIHQSAWQLLELSHLAVLWRLHYITKALLIKLLAISRRAISSPSPLSGGQEVELQVPNLYHMVHSTDNPLLTH